MGGKIVECQAAARDEVADSEHRIDLIGVVAAICTGCGGTNKQISNFISVDILFAADRMAEVVDDKDAELVAAIRNGSGG